MSIIIKPMETDEEIRGKAYVHWKSWLETYSGLVNQQYLGKLSLERCEDIAYRWPDHILVGKEDNNVIGFVAYGKYRDETVSDTGEIYAIYVLQDYHNKKVGYRLVNAAVGKLEKYKNIAVWVLKGNERAIQFYERYGFQFDGSEQEIMLGTPNTELRMLLKR